MKTGSYDKAIEEYNKALLISPNHPAALKGIVETCEKKGDYAGAIDAQKKYIEAVPNPDLTLNRRNLMGKSIPEGFQERQKGAGIAVVPFAG